MTPSEQEKLYSVAAKRKTTVNLAEKTFSYKTIGRTYTNHNGLNVDFAGNGLEFDLLCKGTVSLCYSAAYPVYFQVYIDGTEALWFKTEIGIGLSRVIATSLPGKVHRIRIIRDSDASKTGELMAIFSLSFEGSEDGMRPTENKELYFEFVGDSITAGKYTNMQAQELDAIHKATNSYAYLTAQALDADFSILARGGCGFFRVSTCPKTMHQLYLYYNGFAHGPILYHPKRRADVAVLALGTNDSASDVKISFEDGTVPFSTFDKALVHQIRLIRKLNGEQVKIVLLYNMMSSAWEAEFLNVAKREKIFCLKVTKNREGGRNHPSKAGHRVFAEELIRYLKDVVLK